MRNRLLIVQFNIAHFSHHASTSALIPLLPLLRPALGLNYFQSGILVSAFSLSLGLGQVPMAILADRFSRRLLIIVGLVGVAFAGIGVGLSATFWQMVLCVIAMGLFGSTYHAPASSFLSQALPLGQRGRALGLHVVGGAASFLVTPVAALWFAAVFHSWRASFLILAAPAFFASLILWFGTEEIGRREPVNLGTDLGRSEKESPESWSKIIRSIGLLASFVMSMQLVVSSVNSYLPLYMVDRHQVSPAWAGLVTGIVSGGGMIGAPLAGALSDEFGRKRVILAALILSGPLLLAVTQAPYGILLLLSLTSYGMVMVARMPLAESLIADNVSVARRTTVLGIYFLVSQETAGIVTPIVGRLIDLYGTDVVLVGIGAGLCGVGALAWFLRKSM